MNGSNREFHGKPLSSAEIQWHINNARKLRAEAMHQHATSFVTLIRKGFSAFVAWFGHGISNLISGGRNGSAHGPSLSS